MAGRASDIKMGDEEGGSLISPDGVAPSRIVGVSASVIFPCTIKSRRSFLLAPAQLGSPRKVAVKRMCVCVHVQDHRSIGQLMKSVDGQTRQCGNKRNCISQHKLVL